MLEEKNIFVGGVEFTSDRKTLVRFPEDAEIQEYTVPAGTNRIGCNAFFNCRRLRKIILPDTLFSIGDKAFWGCTNLQSLLLPETLLEIGCDAFYMTSCENDMKEKYPAFFSFDPIKEYIARSICKTREQKGSFPKVDADTASNINRLRHHRKNTGKENQTNSPLCADCGCGNAGIKFREQFFCKSCADLLLANLKRKYYAGTKDIGWEIQDLWEQLRDRTDLWSGDENSFLEADELTFEQQEDMALAYRSSDAQHLLQAFVREKLDGDIHNFKFFDFETLKYDEIFGCSSPENFDCDNTYIIRAVYVLLWGNVFPDMTDWHRIGTGKSYRGDTVHTFHTVFGRTVPEKNGHFYGIDRFAPVDDALYARIRRFHKKVSSLGNYVVLPNLTVKTKERFVTLNTYRGTNQWHDYFDRFLLALEPCLTHGDKTDETLYQLVHKRNSRAFETYKTTQGFTQLAKKLLLEDYLDDNGHAKNLFADANGKVHFHWENPQPSRELYLERAVNYLDHAERIISNRADRMIEMLKTFC